MAQLNTAQKMVTAWLGVDPDYSSADTLRVAVEQTRMMRQFYKAPYAPRGTPPKSPRRVSIILAPRLFKGHRP